MANFNKVILIGNLTKDGELRFTPKGTAIAQLGLAVNRRYTTESGEKKEEVTWVDVTAFSKQAETICQYCKKGSPLLVEGRLKTESWTDKTTSQKRSKMVVILEGFQFLGGKSDESTPRQSAPAPARKIDPADVPPGSTPVAATDAPPSDDDDSSVPF